ncbi:hypothetical protein DFS34DRAFT_590997 [Phlyctochytrium arcticum]|nr:hypothetical protein DFS34DRAFT_590997 [Phlyctochytrium arcticum]
MSEQQTPVEDSTQVQEPVESVTEQVETNNSDPIDKIENMKKAQEKRTANLREMKKLKEQHDKEIENAKLHKQMERDEEIARKAIEKYVLASKPKKRTAAKKVNVSSIQDKKQEVPK